MKIYTVLILLSIAITAAAQNKIDYGGREFPDNPDTTYSVIVELDRIDADLGDCKAEIVSRIGKLAVLNATAAQIDSIAALPQVVKVSAGGEQKPLETQSPSAKPIARREEEHGGIKSVLTGIWHKIKSVF